MQANRVWETSACVWNPRRVWHREYWSKPRAWSWRWQEFWSPRVKDSNCIPRKLQDPLRARQWVPGPSPERPSIHTWKRLLGHTLRASRRNRRQLPDISPRVHRNRAHRREPSRPSPTTRRAATSVSRDP